MGQNQSELDKLLQRDWREEHIPRMGTEPFVTVCATTEDHSSGVFSVLVPNDAVTQVLQEYQWDVRFGEGGHQVCQDDEEGHTYSRFSAEHRIEQIVHVRSFGDVRTEHLELAEEYRLFHNLYLDAPNGEFQSILADGTEQLAGRIGPALCEIRTRQLRQYLAIRRMHLAIYFWSNRYSPIALTDVPGGEIDEMCKADLTIYRFSVSDWSRERDPRKRTFSRLVGKKLIAPLELDRCGIWPYEDKPAHETFLIGADKDGVPVEHTCDPSRLVGGPWPDGDGPHFLTHVFFQKGVLGKYSANPKLYNLRDGALHCASLWSLKLDNNHPTHVVAYLGDLGQIPYSEQKHWRSHNVPPDDLRPSEVSIARNIRGEWTNPQAPDLVLKLEYHLQREAWRRRYDWHLLRELGEGDAHCLAGLREVTIDDHAEFDKQVLNLTKLLVDAINEGELGKHISKVKDEKGISKLRRYLESLGLPDIATHFGFLRDLQDVRSGAAAHWKGENFEKVAAKLGFEEKGLPKVFEELLGRGTAFLRWLRAWCEQGTPEPGA